MLKGFNYCSREHPTANSSPALTIASRLLPAPTYRTRSTCVVSCLNSLLHDNLLFDRLFVNVSPSYASMWRGFVENCDFESSFLYASMKIFDGFIPSIKLLYLFHEALLEVFASKLLILPYSFKETSWEHDLAKEQELCYFWNSYGIATLVDKLNAILVYSLLSVEYLGNFHSIVPFNTSISNVACLLWVFEGMDLRMNPFKGRTDGMIRDVQGIVELLQGRATRAMARRIEENTEEKYPYLKR
ncbi:hypothetical protein M9H77_03756 [Catharanthus roseus]|uniref:Uncharacterized protein n=1 Tax=Catharanthus roseus TaxID=4058 RepID=A0ACC0CCM6_CATRO|nr:hypothetical protein M9H77_03756 [Catharanthus roseus]